MDIDETLAFAQHLKLAMLWTRKMQQLGSRTPHMRVGWFPEPVEKDLGGQVTASKTKGAKNQPSPPDHPIRPPTWDHPIPPPTGPFLPV